MNETYSGATAWTSRPTERYRAPATATPTAVIHYTIYLPDGHSISSHETGQPFRFQPNGGQIIPGLEQAIATMEIGETRRIRLSPRQAFGDHRADRVMLARHDQMRTPVSLRPGMPVRLARDSGLSQAFVRDLVDDGVIFDLNHPLAGVELTMDVTLLAYE